MCWQTVTVPFGHRGDSITFTAFLGRYIACGPVLSLGCAWDDKCIHEPCLSPPSNDELLAKRCLFSSGKKAFWHCGCVPHVKTTFESLMAKHCVCLSHVPFQFVYFISLCSISLLIVEYFVPLAIISFAYMRIAFRLWGSRTPGAAQDQRDHNILVNKKKVIIATSYPKWLLNCTPALHKSYSFFTTPPPCNTSVDVIYTRPENLFLLLLLLYPALPRC